MEQNRTIVIVRLLGGLGNQLFQYACGKSLALHKNARLLLDLRYFEYYSQWTSYYRNFELFAFNIDAEILSEETIEWLQEELINCEDDVISTYECIDSIDLPCYLSGNWQSWKYFSMVEPQIRKDFSFQKEKLPPPVREFGHILCESASVAVHIRRTDFNLHKNILPLDYYQNAVSYMNEQILNPVYYIFSDDPEWVEHSFSIPCNFQLIKGNSGLEDFYLMSCCQHAIIANSTFSWWAAWLSDNTGKVIVIPEKWYLSPQLNKKSSEIDIVPPGWKTIRW
ncbi:alpha-1,2-fucosyltransferase [Parabacteroides goldsteinii]|jgi:hypothetical protein